MRRVMLILLLLLGAADAGADDFGSRLNKGNELLRQGKTAEAMAVFDALKAEEPSAPDLLFSLGCAQYAQAMPKEDGQPAADALDKLKAARENFEKAATLSSGKLARDATYNRNNVTARMAEMQQASEADAKAAYEKSIQDYEAFLKRHPEHEKARHDLDALRFKMKQEQQQPPPQEQPKSGQDQEKQDQGDQQQQQNQGGQGEQQEDRQQQQQGDQNSQENRQDDSQEQQPGDKQQNTPEQQAGQDAQQNASPEQKQGQQKAMTGQEDKDSESLKSLLESLENVDKEEQKQLREAPRQQGERPEWW